MKKKTLKRIAASLSAIAVIAASAPAIPAVDSFAAGVVFSSSFDSGVGDWSFYKESGGACKISNENGKLAFKITNVGTKNYAVQLCYDIIPLYKNGVYRIHFEVSSTANRFIEFMIQQNGGTYQAYTWKGIDVTSAPQPIDYQFTMEEDTDIMTKLCFNCGLQEADPTLPEHTIYLDNVSLELVDDSNVDYSASRPYAPDININQVGYRTDAKKTAVFREVNNGQSAFDVVDAKTNQTVYTGQLINQKSNSSADETNWQGDFSSVTEPGNYFIKCNGLDDSYTFTIGDHVYDTLLDDSVRMLYLQRCGCEVVDSKFGHAACHTDLATVYGTNQKIDVTGGWHDAGDYGRYTVAASKAVADLMYAYDFNPKAYSDNIGIPESNNGVPDILDETRYELEWMLKMQASDGGVYHKVSCATFPGYVMPTEETGEFIVTPVSSTATADFCGAMALAYETYKDIDATFANKCLDAAKKSWNWLQQNPNFLFKNPEDISTGEYGDKSDKDERYWAAAQMYRATGDASYMSSFSTASSGLDWATVGDYGNIALVTMKDADTSSSAYANAKSKILSQADKFVTASASSPYGVAISKYDWGSNMTIANAGIVLGLAYKMTNEQKYLDAANAQQDYLLGTNPCGVSFVTGYGTVSPENPHHRPSMAVGEAMKGMLVGGVNQNLEDSAAKAYTRDYPNAERWVDNSESYSTNEITIYWNSPLTYLLTLTNPTESIIGPDIPDPPTTTTTTTEPVTTTTTTTADVPETTTTVPDSEKTFGDANHDGTVSVADPTFIMQAAANPNDFKFDEVGADLADVESRGDGVTSADALLIQKFLAGSISKLPQ